MTTAHLDFTVRIAAPGTDLADVAALRAQAYGHHLPGLAQGMAQPDAADTAPGSTVLLCRDKASGRAIGSARIQRNHPRPLPIEASLALPAALSRCHAPKSPAWRWRRAPRPWCGRCWSRPATWRPWPARSACW